MTSYDIIYAGQKASDLGVKIARRPNVPIPEANTISYQVGGNDGELVEYDGTYKDLYIQIKMNFICDKTDWGKELRKIKRWLLSPTMGKLKFADDPEVFYKVKKVSIGDTERRIQKSGEISPIFACDPYTYFESGVIPHMPEECRLNAYDLSKPIYKIAGQGLCDISVNGKRLGVNVEGNATIDTEKMIVYRNGNAANASLAGDYENLWLNPGNNTIYVTPEFEVQIIPNWRAL